MRWGSVIMGWLAAAGVVALVALRWVGAGTPLLIGLVGVAWLGLLVALVVLAVTAVRSGSRALRVAAAVVTAAYLVTFTNVRGVVGCGPETAEDAITVFLHNVYLFEGDPVRVAGSVAGSGADVVVLMEVSPDFLAEFERQAGLEAYGYRVSEPRYGTNGQILWSRWPLEEVQLRTVAGTPMLQATLATPAGPVVVHTLHASAPVNREQVVEWETQLAQLAGIDRSQPSIAIGDFNATIDHAQFRRVLEAGWTDVHTPKGCGPDQTWPAGRGLGLPLMRLDHVLVSDHFQVLSVEIGDPDGSDHHSVTTAVRLTDSD